MYDSVTPSAIPANAEVVAGYVDGLYAWSDADWARFPNAAKVRIAVFAWDDADVLDVEPGDASPTAAADWIRRQQARGVARPVIYCDLSAIDAVRIACAGLTWDWWAAHYTGTPHLEGDSVATQYADPATSGGQFDLSLCRADWPA